MKTLILIFCLIIHCVAMIFATAYVLDKIQHGESSLENHIDVSIEKGWTLLLKLAITVTISSFTILCIMQQNTVGISLAISLIAGILAGIALSIGAVLVNKEASSSRTRAGIRNVSMLLRLVHSHPRLAELFLLAEFFAFLVLIYELLHALGIA